MLHCVVSRTPSGVLTPRPLRLARPQKHHTRTLRRLQASSPEAPVRPFPADAAHLKTWKPDCWRSFQVLQQPDYPDESHLRNAIDALSSFPPLVFAGECRNLQTRLAEAAVGDAFVIQGGDCAEAFSQFDANKIRDSYRVLLQMGLVLTFGGGIPVIKMGRMAGQFAKPRSAPFEEKNGVKLPSYRGDIINSAEFTEAARVPNPERLIQAYNQSASTLNLLRGFSSGGYASLDRVAAWDLDFMHNSMESKHYLDLAHRVTEAIVFMEACGVDRDLPTIRETEFYTGHECLLLEYEQALTRMDSTTDLWYDCSGHFLWIGERTRQLEGGHLAFIQGVANPLGVKISDKITPSELVTLVSILNPNNVPGRCSLVVRMGAEKLSKNLPPLIEAVRNAGQIVTWISDPMHGNTESCNGYKTRRLIH